MWVPRTVPYLEARKVAKTGYYDGYRERLVYIGKADADLLGFARDCQCEERCYGGPYERGGGRARTGPALPHPGVALPGSGVFNRRRVLSSGRSAVFYFGYAGIAPGLGKRRTIVIGNFDYGLIKAASDATRCTFSPRGKYSPCH